MFERFTDRARRVIVGAQEEARLLGHDYIGTEHILLGLLWVGDGPGYAALTAEGVTLDGMRAQVVDIVGRGDRTPSGHIPFTPRAKKVLELSLREALQLGDSFIGTEHVLLGLVREGEGVACQAIVASGVDLPAVRARLLVVLGRARIATDPPGRTRRSRLRSLRAPRGEPAPPDTGRDQLPVLRRFTPGAWHVALLAQSEALRLGATAVGEEHMLLGILAEAGGRGARALDAVGVRLDVARERADALYGTAAGTAEARPVEAAFAPDGLDVIEFALVEALAAGRHSIDTGDLLLGFVRRAESGEGEAAGALGSLGTTADAVRAAVAGVDTDEA